MYHFPWYEIPLVSVGSRALHTGYAASVEKNVIWSRRLQWENVIISTLQWLFFGPRYAKITIHLKIDSRIFSKRQFSATSAYGFDIRRFLNGSPCKLNRYLWQFSVNPLAFIVGIDRCHLDLLLHHTVYDTKEQYENDSTLGSGGGLEIRAEWPFIAVIRC